MSNTIFSAPEQVGIDSKIYRIQLFLSKYFSDLWYGDHEYYGRLYKTQGENGNHPEAWVGGKDYKEVFVNDKKALVVGFIEQSREIRGRELYATISVVFTGNINLLLNTTDRKDERIFLQIYQGLRKSMLIESVSNPKRGVEDVFSGFIVDGLKFRDMHPFFCFSFDIEIQYTENIC